MGSNSTKVALFKTVQTPCRFKRNLRISAGPTPEALAAMTADLDEACRQAEEISARVKAELIAQARLPTVFVGGQRLY
jgi:hypothetical protein